MKPDALTVGPEMITRRLEALIYHAQHHTSIAQMRDAMRTDLTQAAMIARHATVFTADLDEWTNSVIHEIQVKSM